MCSNYDAFLNNSSAFWFSYKMLKNNKFLWSCRSHSSPPTQSNLVIELRIIFSSKIVNIKYVSHRTRPSLNCKFRSSNFLLKSIRLDDKIRILQLFWSIIIIMITFVELFIFSSGWQLLENVSQWGEFVRACDLSFDSE